MTRRWLCLLLPFLLVGCASGRVVRLDTGGADSVVVTPREEEGASLEDAEPDDGEFEAAVSALARDVRPFMHPLREARTFFGVPERSGVFGFDVRTRRVVALGEVEARELHLLDDASAELTRAYGRWCERKKQGRVGSQKHHLATLRNSTSSLRGGPWTPRFQRLFRKAGMELKDPENIVEVPGHRGPHPQRYHQRVYDRLEEATRGCRSVNQCREMLVAELRKLGQEASTQGTGLNKLLTRSE
ncbi:MAG: hypothetical protein EOO72_02455 [Myxococcaceae bacterium]|nr:MAG: hypothetical protein EOO72_02455 [Myxococcaceae bacterium]